MATWSGQFALLRDERGRQVGVHLKRTANREQIVVRGELLAVTNDGLLLGSPIVGWSGQELREWFVPADNVALVTLEPRPRKNEQDEKAQEES